MQQSQQFPVELYSLRLLLQDRIATATKAVEYGRDAVAKSQNDPNKLEYNKKALANAENTLTQLNTAMRACMEACCNDRENCDPDFQI
jgi:hypothetical protein